MTAKNILAGVGVATIAVILIRFLVPIFNWEGVVTDGSYRGLEIGSQKGDVAMLLSGSTDRFNKLKLIGYEDEVGKFQLVFWDPADRPIIESDVWHVRYPGIHKEIISLHFENEVLKKVRYVRAMMDP